MTRAWCRIKEKKVKVKTIRFTAKEYRLANGPGSVRRMLCSLDAVFKK